jgi:DNA-binding beta-propeller fold protein YncE
LWAADLCGTNTTATPCTWADVSTYSGADMLSGSPETWLRSIPIAPTPVLVAGLATSTSRFFSISQGNSLNGGSNISSAVACNSPSTVTVNGEADGILTASYTISSQIPLGICPVYAVASSDAQRLFVLNRGSDTISVINIPKDELNSCTPFTDPETGRQVTCHPTLPLSTTAVSDLESADSTYTGPVNGIAGMTATAGPVYAEYNTAKSLLVVANYDGGTISVIDVSLDEWGNDSATFGTTYTIPVGTNPASVTVLYEGDRAYVANQADQTVTIVNLSSHIVEKTLSVTGHPRTVVSTENSEYGKVYVASPDSNVLTIISTGGTNPDSVSAAPTVQGNIVDVRVQAQNGISGNANNESRTPGYGQPCNLPGTTYTASLSSCQAVK